MKKEILPAVAAAIFNEKGEILLQRRKDVGKWCVISGHVEFGETVEEAILREIWEETNTTADILRLIGVYSAPSSQTYNYSQKTIQYITCYFEARFKQEIDCTYTNNETQELRFFPTHAIPNDLAQINPHWLKDALRKNADAYVR